MLGSINWQAAHLPLTQSVLLATVLDPSALVGLLGLSHVRHATLGSINWQTALLPLTQSVLLATVLDIIVMMRLLELSCVRHAILESISPKPAQYLQVHAAGVFQQQMMSWHSRQSLVCQRRCSPKLCRLITERQSPLWLRLRLPMSSLAKLQRCKFVADCWLQQLRFQRGLLLLLLKLSRPPTALLLSLRLLLLRKASLLLSLYTPLMSHSLGESLG
mmetsp:Transcript_24858/g.50486  ORF Transcript_24858/g.50486 Transcript_24858/m.50486 type:complete len:218 (+) Transcript_24858:605-1258(+)